MAWTTTATAWWTTRTTPWWAGGAWYADLDGDGYGDDANASVACEPAEGWVQQAGDCDDANAEVFPGAPERCDGLDNDCDGAVDEDLAELWYEDGDGDGFGDQDAILESCDPGPGWVADDSDCDDRDGLVFPGAPELCNGYDDDCDGEVDEELGSVWFEDDDGDGFGDPDASTIACDPGPGWVADDGDCDDANSDINPDADERCNGYDDDCDALVDDADPDVIGAAAWYLDVDGDGYGADSGAASACEQPSGYVAYGGDCDDSDAAYNPGAVESDCTDPADYNCDGSTGYSDLDGDGWAACEDCDDGDAAIRPDGSELCNGVDDDCDGDIDEDSAADAATWYQDGDGDGYGDAASTVVACDEPSGYSADATDCDDTDAAVSPAGAERCNGVDDDCDGDVDEGVQDTFHADADGDGWGDAAVTTTACDLPSGYADNDGDCDDSDAAVSPDGVEQCNGYDDDCDGAVDEASSSDAATWYADDDGDGFGDAAATTASCVQPSGYVADASDCDDGDAAVSPDASELCDGVDNDCDGAVDEDSAADAATWYADVDGDGYGDAGSATAACSQPSGTVADASDCDDADAAVSPAGTEQCNGYDDDCDGVVDEDSSSDAAIWYADVDGDGYGDAGSSTAACSQPSGTVADASDCDDSDPSAFPGATEQCDGVDNDCDGVVDEDDASDASTWYADSDGDGYGDASASAPACSQPSGYVADSSDCDDADAAVSPAGTEQCNGLDDDCDGAVDEDSAVDAATWYADVDGDGYGDAGSATAACSQPSGYVADASDCDDGDAAVSPAGVEACNGYDDDCDGLVDDADAGPTGTSTWYADGDGDSYGAAGSSTTACAQPSGYVADASDCDDGDAAVSPAGTELCNGYDDDCDGAVDEASAADAATWYADADGDSYGAAGSSVSACSQPSGYVSNAGDCDDGDAAVSPLGSEVCNGYDDDCDGLVDDDDVAVGGTSTWYQDLDLDGYGDSTVTTAACDEPSGYTNDATDCDDGDPDINPGASEACNGVDDDCDSSIDEGSVCPCTVVENSGHAYMFCTTLTPWTTAQAACWSYDYHMLTIDSATEDAWVNTQADSYSIEKWWFGFNDRATEGSWVWEDGSAVSYTDWHASEPNDSGGNEDCAQLNRYHPDNYWNDEPCTSAFRYICEAD